VSTGLYEERERERGQIQNKHALGVADHGVNLLQTVFAAYLRAARKLNWVGGTRAGEKWRGSDVKMYVYLICFLDQPGACT
jgi:hypothetical protein